uniref:von Willebrand factor A domain containing 5B1 n=1 Tax=Salvator merianae TaxID=96440 RepID=A0A8D0DN48_SALMN
MPGLVNRTTNTALPLTASEVTSCVSGYAFGMTASLTYGNPEMHPFEGLFVYPLDEYTTVVGFEAMVSKRVVTVQIKDKARIDDSFTFPADHGFLSLDTGRIVLDEDLERTVFVANIGIVAPQESVSVCISTSSELRTLPSGVVRVLLPAVCVPKVPQYTKSLHSEQLHQPGKFCLAQLLETEATNPTEYEFSFYLEIRGPCLLAGVESPTHEIRADADPCARSAKSIVITLANKHTFDRPVEILIHPSEPHMPHVLMEEGDMNPIQYEQHLKGRNDFIRGTKKDPSAEKKMEIIRKRLHKDIPHHPVIMLNFCPDLRAVQPNLRKTQGEFIFLVDRSGSMSGVNISRVKEALLVILKSLMPTCLFNIIGFGSTFKALFPSSQTYCEETLATACESIQKIRADMGVTNVLSPLKWIIRQPIHQGHPRLLFLLTDGAVSNTGKVIELVRNHSFSTRCYTFGIGQNACRRLVNGLAAVSKGSAEFLAEGERLQPKMIKSLKKAMAPVVSDVSVDWVFPETTEVLISPISTCCLFPGDRLVAYSIVCDTSLYTSNPRLDKRRRYSMLRSQESGSSVFFHSQEDGGSLDNWSGLEDLFNRQASVFPGVEAVAASSRRRAYSTNQIADREPFRKIPTASDPSSAMIKNPLRKAPLQDLSQITPDASQRQVEFQVGPFAASPYIAATKIRGVGARRPSVLHHRQLSLCHAPESPQLNVQTGADKAFGQPNTLLFSDIRNPAQHPSFLFETETSSDWELHGPEPGSASLQRSPRSICKAVVKGVRNNEPVQWEVAFDTSPLFHGGEHKGTEDEDLWSETFHHLAAKSIIRDFEQLSEKECEIEHGSGRRYRVNALHTSKTANVISKYTAFLPVDLSNTSYLPAVVEYPNAGRTALLARDDMPRSYSSSLTRDTIKINTTTQDFPTSTPSIPHSQGLRLHARRSRSVLNCECLPSRSRLTFNKTRLLTRAAQGFMGKSLSKTNEPIVMNDGENVDYLPLVSLQLACGSFLLNKAFCDAINIPLEKLKWTSPFACHRMALSPSANSCSSRKSGTFEEDKSLESMLWATAVALAWLEHSSASYFIEWELVAAKASLWLSEQDFPEGRSLLAVKAAAQQLFVLLRHWDENLEFNLLCYNPKNV